ncbi:hypothetical protein ACF0H5_013010 [Mactra antiquata]
MFMCYSGGWLRVTFADKHTPHPRPLLSVSPPKITSKVIGDLLRTMPSSSYTDMSPDTPPQSPLTSAQPDSL